MKRLTVIASLLLVPTFIVGVYGQNFDHMPELHWRFGYAWSLGLIVVTTIVQLVFFRGSAGSEPAVGNAAAVAVADPRSLAGGDADLVATIAACRTSSARTARTARSTTTGARD